MDSRHKFLVVASSTLLVALLLIGSLLGKNASSADGAYPQLSVFTQVLTRIKSEYVEEPDMKSVSIGAVNGLLESIDPYASYLNPEQFQEYQRARGAHKGDAGLILSKKFGYLGVVGAVPGSAAEKAGLATGDMIESIGGITTRDMPLAYAGLMLQGEPGSAVEISAVRVRRSTEPQKIELTRAVLKPPAVEFRLLGDSIGYVRPATLAAGKVKEAAAAIESLQKQGARRLILDLRNTAVGAADQGVALANLFVSSGTLAYLQGQRVPRQNFDAEAGRAMSSLPLAVLVNRGTADGAEIAAAALLEHKRAEVVGERTYGDAALRRPVTLEDGSAVILSVAKYYSPNGKAIQDTGVTPGTLVAEVEAQVELDENGEAVPQSEPEPQTLDDPILKKAIEGIRNR